MSTKQKYSGRRTGRRFGLTDVAILIAATAVGMAVARHFLPTDYSPSPGDLRFSYLAPPSALSWVVVAQPVLMSWSAAWILLLLRQPRPRLRRLAYSPGFRACFAAALTIVIAGPWVAGFMFSESGYDSSMSFLAFLCWTEAVSLQIGIGVIVAWAPSLMIGSARGRTGWFGRAGWPERGGFFLGCLWILLMPVNLLRMIWYYLGI